MLNFLRNLFCPKRFPKLRRSCAIGNHSNPVIDVIMPVRNGMPFVREAVNSALEQVGVSIRVILVDDGSTDGTVDAVSSLEDPRITIYEGHRSESASAGRNRGVLMSDAEWICFLDSDDLWPKHRTRRLYDAIDDRKKVMSMGFVMEFQNDLRELDDERITEACKPALCVGGTLLSRELFNYVGPLNEELRVAEYVDWLCRARDLGIREVVVPTISLFRRVHQANTSTARRKEYARDVFRLVMEHRERITKKS